MSLDNFVDSIQSIPEVHWKLNIRQLEIMDNCVSVMVVCLCVRSCTSAPLNANVLIYFFFPQTLKSGKRVKLSSAEVMKKIGELFTLR